MWGVRYCRWTLLAAGRNTPSRAIANRTREPSPLTQTGRYLLALPPGDYEVRLFDRGFFFGGLPALATASFRVWDAAGCVPSPTALPS